jgi:hypothetical protein
MSEVFISYSTTDRYFAELLVRELGALGLDVFWDRLIPAGAPWSESVDHAITSAEFVLVSLSPAYLASSECQHQLNLALLCESQGKALVVPLIIEDCALPELIQQKAYADFKFDFSIGVDALIHVLLGVGAGVSETIIPGYERRAISTARLAKLRRDLQLASEQRLRSPRVFLCHAVEDKARVDQIYFILGSSGLDPWYDKAKLLAGDRWESEIIKAIEQSDFFVIFLSSTSIKKQGFIHKEIRAAVQEFQMRPDSQVYFMPVRLDDCQVPRMRLDATTFLSDLQWIDLHQNSLGATWDLARAIWRQWVKRHETA